MNIYMHVRIAYTLKARKESRASNMSFDLDKQFRQVVSMLIINGELFFLLCSVNLIGRFMDFQNPFNRYQIEIWRDVENFCNGLNASINPIVYSLTNQRYRRAFYKAYSMCSFIRLRHRKENTQPNIAITKL